MITGGGSASQLSPEVAAACAALADDVTLPRLLRRNATEFADLPALTCGEVTLTWRQLRSGAMQLANGLDRLGLRAGERMMIMMASRPEHWLVDFGAVHLGAIPCTVYQTSSTEQIEYLARHSAATVAVLDGATELARWLPVIDELPALRTVIVLDTIDLPDDSRFIAWADMLNGEANYEPVDHVEPDDPIAMMYTSGTTGDPKGVVLTHRNAFYEAIALDAVLPLPMNCAAVAYLPLAHIAERELGMYRAAYKAQHVTVCADPAQLVAALVHARPAAFFGVPRVWEKLAGGLSATIASLPLDRRTVVEQAHEVLGQVFRLAGTGADVPVDLAQRAAELDEAVLRPIRAALGFDTVVWATSGSAPIPVEVLEYLGGFGIRVLEVWGMSETTGCATVSVADGFRPGAVGRALPGVELRIADDGEIFVRGAIVFAGYLDADGTIVSAVDADGWLATGDVGTMDAAGFLTITDRKKELLITSSGKNVAPSGIEGLLRAHPLVGAAMAIGDRRPYLTALISLDGEIAPAWAAARGLPFTSLDEFALDPAVAAEIDELVKSVNERLSRAEQLKRHRLIGVQWTPESGELTPTLKLRRRIVLERYDDVVGALYD